MSDPAGTLALIGRILFAVFFVIGIGAALVMFAFFTTAGEDIRYAITGSLFRL
jgi:hypothetical protein